MVGMNRKVRKFHETITGDKNETSYDLVALHDDPNLIVGNVLRASVGNSGEIGDALGVFSICCVDTGRQGIGVRRLRGAYDRILSRQNCCHRSGLLEVLTFIAQNQEPLKQTLVRSAASISLGSFFLFLRSLTEGPLFPQIHKRCLRKTIYLVAGLNYIANYIPISLSLRRCPKGADDGAGGGFDRVVGLFQDGHAVEPFGVAFHSVA